MLFSVFFITEGIILVSQHVDQVISVNFILFHFYINVMVIFLRIVFFTADHGSYFVDDFDMIFIEIPFLFFIYFKVTWSSLDLVVRWKFSRGILT